MKKQIAILATILATSGLSAFGQGYIAFASAAAHVYDNTTGTGTLPSTSDIDVAFLWAATTATDPFGAGLATTGAVNASGGFADLTAALSGGWTVAVNNGTSLEADQVAGTTGGITYNSSTSFAVTGITGGSVYQIIVIGWDNEGGTINTLEAAESGNTLGWSGSFDYTSGATASSTVSPMSNSGLVKFGVAAVPEPTTLALAGLGGLSMLFLRRRKA